MRLATDRSVDSVLASPDGTVHGMRGSPPLVFCATERLGEECSYAFWTFEEPMARAAAIRVGYHLAARHVGTAVRWNAAITALSAREDGSLHRLLRERRLQEAAHRRQEHLMPLVDAGRRLGDDIRLHRYAEA